MESTDDPVAIRRDVFLVIVLTLQVLLVGLLVRGLVAPLLGALRDGVLEAQLLGHELVVQLLRCGHLLLVVQLGDLLALHAVLDLIVQVLDDHGQDAHDALRFALTVALVGEDCIGRLVFGDPELWRLLREDRLGRALHVAHLDLVLGIKFGERMPGRHQQVDRLLVLLLRFQKGLIFGLLLCGDGRHVCLGLLDLLDRLLLLLRAQLDQLREFVDLGDVLLDLPIHVLDCALDLLVLILALVALLDVIGLLPPQRGDDAVNHHQNLLEVANLGRLDLHGEGRQPVAVALPGAGPEGGESLGGWGAIELDERRGDVAAGVAAVHAGFLARLDGRGEELASSTAGQDFERLRDASDLLLAEAAAHLPRVVLGRAGILRHVEEIDVGLLLLLGVVVQGLRVGKVLLGLCLLGLLLGLRLLHGVQLLGLRGDEVLEVCVRGGLRLRRGLQVRGEGLVHVLEDALHGHGLRRVARAHVLAQQRELPRLQGLRGRQGVDDSRDLVPGGRLQQGRGALPEHGDGLFHGRDGLLQFGAVGREGDILLLPDARRLGLLLAILPHVGLEALDLRRERGDVALEGQNGLAEGPEVGGGVRDGVGLVSRRLLAPAGVLVIDLLLLFLIHQQLLLHVCQEGHHPLNGRARCGFSQGQCIRANRACNQQDQRQREGQAGKLHCRRPSTTTPAKGAWK
mmetsp:Transcript_25065/g.63829  ORF Transcript_25065/g.63829 Transcript_25065/m.63829 type:complete len:684 (-) Transcript_25065:20-2071(-)